MARNGIEQSKIIVEEKTQPQGYQPAQQQITPRDWSRERKVAVWLFSVGLLGFASILLRVWPYPHNLLAGFAAAISLIVAGAFFVHDLYKPPIYLIVLACFVLAVVAYVLIVPVSKWLQAKAEPSTEFRINEQPIVTIGKKDGTIAAVDETGTLRLYFLNSGHLPALNFSVMSPVARSMPFMPIRRTYRKDGSIDDGPRPHEVTIAPGSVYPAPLALSPQEFRQFTIIGQFFFLPMGFQYCDRFGQYVCKSFDLFAGVGPKGFGPFQIEGEIDCDKSPFTVFMPPDERKITAPPCPRLS
jgi:hypothetical protein